MFTVYVTYSNARKYSKMFATIEEAKSYRNKQYCKPSVVNVRIGR